MLDKRTIKNILSIMDLIRIHDWDWFMFLDGDERSGKTVAALQVLLVSEPGIMRDVLSGDYKSFLGRTAWSFESMLQILKVTGSGTGTLYDEASIFGREAMTPHNRRMVRVMATVGMLNRLYIWTFPDFHMLDPYIRYGRCRTRGYVKTVRGKRGYIVWYVRKRNPWGRGGNELLTVFFKRAFTGRFSLPKDSNVIEAFAKFTEREHEAKMKIIDGDVDVQDPVKTIAINMRKLGFTYRVIGNATGKSTATIGRWLQDVKVEKIEVGN